MSGSLKQKQSKPKAVAVTPPWLMVRLHSHVNNPSPPKLMCVQSRTSTERSAARAYGEGGRGELGKGIVRKAFDIGSSLVLDEGVECFWFTAASCARVPVLCISIETLEYQFIAVLRNVQLKAIS